MILRAARADDAPALAGLCLLVFLDTYCKQGLRADLTAEALQTGDVALLAAQIADPHGRQLLIEHEVDGERHVLAYAGLRLGDGDAELVRLYLHPRFQRQGLGRRLLQAAEASARDAGAAQLWLDCWSGNDRALAFYTACGYIDQGATVYSFGGRDYANRRLVRKLF